MEILDSTSTLEDSFRMPNKDAHILYYYRKIESPVGLITLVSNEKALVSLIWGSFEATGKCELASSHPILMAAEIQLKEYFMGQRTSFDIPLDLKGTEFQKRVWKELTKIPYGQTMTYAEQARNLGQPKSARAVGTANGKNPISVIIPCHRVIGTDGSLTGYAGGLEIKRQLLAIEGKEVK